MTKNDFAPVLGHRFNLRGEWGVLPLIHGQRVVWLDAPAS